MNFLIYFIISVLSIYFWYRKNYGHRNNLLAKFPAPKSYPILNHYTYFMGKSPVEIFNTSHEFYTKYGPVFKVDLNPFISSISVGDPKIVEEILSSQKLIDKANEYDMISHWLGRGLILSTGKIWHQRRKIITPAFHFKILEQFVDVMEKHGHILIEKLDRTNGSKIDIFPAISLYTLDVICESAMGYELKAQEDETSEYVKAVQEISSIFFQKIFDPKKRIQFFYQFTDMCQREKIVIKQLHDFTFSVINARRKYWADYEIRNDDATKSVDEFGIKQRTAFLDLLLQSKIDGNPLDDADIREEVDTFMFAGHDTTSAAISFALLNLAKNSDVQEGIYDECREIFADDPNRTVFMQDLNKMIYLEKAIKENLRLYPAVSSYSRKFREDVIIGGYKFPANVSVKILMYAMGRNPEFFPDPLKFDPSRFDDERNIKLFSYVPFSAGPRNCIGQKFAMLEMKSILSKIVRKFHILIEKCDENPEYAQEIVLRPVNGINLRFIARVNN